MIIDIIIFIGALLIAISFCWFMGYRLLRRLGYKIVEEEKDETTIDTNITDTV